MQLHEAGCMYIHPLLAEKGMAKLDHTHLIPRSLLSSEELSHLKEALESDAGILQHSYGRDDGHGRISRMCLWNHPGNDITGMVGRCEKVAGTMEQVDILLFREV